jgi:hypothetical protein
MEVPTQKSTPPSAEERERLGLPEDAPDAVASLANGGKVDSEGERSALDYFLGKTYRPEYTVPVEFETPDGMKTLTFRLWALDDRELQRIDAKHRKDADSPFAKLDSTGFNAELVSKATKYITDGSGRRVAADSAEFVGEIPDPVAAMELRFKYQPGLLDGLSEEIRKLSAYSRDRIGSAQRALVDAAGGS